MAHHWFAIAKAEFLVWSSKAKGRRALVFFIITVFGFFWSFYLIPEVWRIIIGENPLIYSLLMVGLPGLMRTATLVLWMLIFIYPILYALQEIRIGQWEIILSCNASTKSLLTGTFVGKIPSYGLMVLFLAPIFLSPFILAYNVTILGQLIMLGSMLLVVLSTLWISNLVSLAVQAKIGESQRGADLAKALSMVIGLVAGLPLYALVFFAGPISEALGMSILLVFPFTWGADITSWGAILFSPNVTPEMMDLFIPILGFDLLTDTLLLLLFTLTTVVLAFRAADTVFTFQLGARTEVITTVIKENVIFRGIRRASPGPFGVLVVTSLKDFFRKAENLSRLAYGVMMATLMPLIMNVSSSSYPGDDPFFRVFMPMFMMSYMLMIIAAITFGGTGFIESKDHIWAIKNAPFGSKKFITGRLVSYFVSGFPLALVPSIVVVLILGLEPAFILGLFAYSYALLCCTVMVSVGVMSINPNYENTRSRAFAVNTLIISAIVFGTTFVSLIVGFVYLGELLLSGSLGLVGAIVALTVLPLAATGLLMSWVGIKALARPER
ncbi:MAG: hypothetical protein EAX95_00690 [Candidatus Thorarchaeota archaeon]|nr:hypothetical protein [Candidatus Thorarchaeota archaeon]